MLFVKNDLLRQLDKLLGAKNMSQTLKFMFIGDIFGQPGISVFQKWVNKLKEQYKVDAVVVNGENSGKNGLGIHPRIIDSLRHSGASAITTGNHVLEHKDVFMALDERDDIARPANLPSGCPGKGYVLFEVAGRTVAVVNMLGRVFLRDFVDCPFKTMDSLLTFLKTKTNLIFLDFHAEATSEKCLMGHYLDGRVSGVFGTHTHVQTADEQILPKGTAYITDLGFCGAMHSIIGMQYEGILKRFLYHHRMGKMYVELRGPIILNGVVVEIGVVDGMAVSIERIKIIDTELAAVLPPSQ
jgi:hypothetical protein